MDSQRASQVASIGLAMRACAPSLLHTIRGSLHDVAMLAALLLPANAADADDGSAAAKTAQRVRALQAQLDVLERHIALLGGMMTWPGSGGDTVCTTASTLADVLRLLKDEAARRRIRLEDDMAALPPRVFADGRALQRALLTCGAWMAQQLPEGATLYLSGREEGAEAVFEFDAGAVSTSARSASDDEQALLGTIVAAAGGKLRAGPRLQLAFRLAPERIAPSP